MVSLVWERNYLLPILTAIHTKGEIFKHQKLKSISSLHKWHPIENGSYEWHPANWQEVWEQLKTRILSIVCRTWKKCSHRKSRGILWRTRNKKAIFLGRAGFCSGLTRTTTGLELIEMANGMEVGGSTTSGTSEWSLYRIVSARAITMHNPDTMNHRIPVLLLLLLLRLFNLVFNFMVTYSPRSRSSPSYSIPLAAIATDRATGLARTSHIDHDYLTPTIDETSHYKFRWLENEKVSRGCSIRVITGAENKCCGYVFKSVSWFHTVPLTRFQRP